MIAPCPKCGSTAITIERGSSVPNLGALRLFIQAACTRCGHHGPETAAPRETDSIEQRRAAKDRAFYLWNKMTSEESHA